MQYNWLKNYNLLIFENVDSTNSEALRLASSGVHGNFVIFAKQQVCGRGQKGRKWESISGNLHSSILLDSDVDPSRYPELSFVTANAMYEVISNLAGEHGLSLKIELKWPNDLMINGKKVAGILLETINFNKKNYVVIGMGVNIIEAPNFSDRPVTSLFDEDIISIKAEEFLNIFMEKFNKLYKQWCIDGNFIRTRKNWLRRAYNFNKLVTVDDGTRLISGIFQEIDLNGAMCLKLPDGQIYKVYAGDLLVNNQH